MGAGKIRNPGAWGRTGQGRDPERFRPGRRPRSRVRCSRQAAGAGARLLRSFSFRPRRDGGYGGSGLFLATGSGGPRGRVGRPRRRRGHGERRRGAGHKIDAVSGRHPLDTNLIIIAVLAVFVAGLTLVVFSLLSKKKFAEDRAQESAAKAEEILQSARKEAENTLKEDALQAKDYQLQVKLDFDRETRERKNAISQLEKRLLQKEDALDRKTEALEDRSQGYAKKEQELGELGKRLEREEGEAGELGRAGTGD